MSGTIPPRHALDGNEGRYGVADDDGCVGNVDGWSWCKVVLVGFVCCHSEFEQLVIRDPKNCKAAPDHCAVLPLVVALIGCHDLSNGILLVVLGSLPVAAEFGESRRKE